MRLLVLKIIYLINRIKKKLRFRKCNVGVGSEIHESVSLDLKSRIGKNCYVGSRCSISKTDIGNYVSIANNVSIGQGEHLLDEISTSSLFYTRPLETLTMKPCSIGHDVWIGVDAVVLRGVHIGNGAVIGANSVVTKDVPPFAIVVGSPAKVIKYRFNEDKIKEINDAKWWDEELDEAREIINRINKNWLLNEE